MKLEVKNMRSHNGNFVPNQFIIKIKDDIFFQSYSTVIAQKKLCSNNGEYKIILDNKALKYSITTNKYIYKFLNMSQKEIEQKIKSKEIKLKKIKLK